MSTLEPTGYAMQWQEASWKDETGAKFPVPYLPGDEDPDTLVLLGLGEYERVAENVVEYLGAKGLSVAGVKLIYNGSTVEAIETTLANAIPAVMSQMNEYSDNPRPRNVVGTSKGGTEAIMSLYLALGSPNEELYGSVVAINPIGVANEPLGKNGQDRRKKLTRRMERNTILFSNPRLSVEQLPMGELRRITHTLEYEGAPIVKAVAATGRLSILSGVLDFVAPTRELKRALGDHAGLIKRISGPHAPLSKKVGKRQVEKAVRRAVSSGPANHKQAI